jgi:DNA-binding SARP family transcriptional activator/class 3 adenylate cyclase
MATSSSGPLTLLFTDIEGSTRLARKLGDRFEDVLEAHNRILRDSFSAHGGTEVDSAGDGFFVVFARARDAVAAAVEAQRALAAEPWPEDAAVKVRMGIHTGEVTVSGDTHRGVAVHRAARISAAAHGGQIVLSQSTQTMVEDVEALVPDLSYSDLGDQLIKDFDRPVRLYQIVAPGLAERFPPLRGVQEERRARTPADDLSFRLLGSFEVARGGRAVQLGGQKQRAVLAILALDAGRVVSTDRLIDLLWGEQPPKTAATSLQNFVSQLRKTIGADVVVTKPPGYLLNVAAAQVDLNQFERLVSQARSLEPHVGAQKIREALDLWRGPPLADFTFESFAETEISRLEELRLTALEDRVQIDLESGRAAELIGELEVIVRENPLRERPRGQLMLALYRSGRQAEALQAYQETRRTLVEELGIEPTPALQQLHASILRQESALQPQAVAGAGEDRLGEVVRALLSGRLVPVLGPGLSSENGGTLASRLAEAFDCPEEHRGDLTRVSQYVAATQGVGPLYDQLHELSAGEDEPGPVERFLSGLPELARSRGAEHQLFVTTTYGHALERAFEERGEDADIVSFVAQGPNRGKFLHRTPDGSETVVVVPNAYAELSLAERPVILKVHGEADSRPDRGRESFVASEDDYIGYLAQSELANVLPVTLAAKLRRSHLLFISYPVVEWSLRVFLHRVFGDEPISYRSWAVLPGAHPIQHELWRQRGVDLYDIALEDFVTDIERRLGEVAPA